MLARTGQTRRGAIGILAAVAVALTAAPAAKAALSSGDHVSFGGFGPVRVGMSVAQAQAASGTTLTTEVTSPNAGCGYVKPSGGPAGISFMTTYGVIARVDVGTQSVSTPEGVRIGDSERQVYRTYGRRVRRSRHVYVRGGHYLKILPGRASERGRRIVFETNGHRVTGIRAGRLPEAYLVEGCS